MDDIVTYVVEIDSWPQVAVLALVLGYLVWRSHRDSRKVKEVNAGMSAVNDGVGAVLHQVENNSGTSMKDAVDRIEATLTEHIEASEADSERLAALEARYLDPHDHGL